MFYIYFNNFLLSGVIMNSNDLMTTKMRHVQRAVKQMNIFLKFN